MQNSEIKAEVQSWLLDLPSGATTRIQGWINEAIRDACKRHNFRFMEAEQGFTTAARTRELGSKPARWKESRGLPYYIRQDGSAREIEWAASESDMVRTYAVDEPAEGNATPVDEGPPRWLLERPDTIDVYPLPDEGSDWLDGNYRLVVPFWQYPEDLSADADENFITVEAPYYVIWKAAALGMRWNRDTENALLLEAEAEKQFRRLERQDKLARLPDRMNLAVHADVYHGRSRRGQRG